MKTKLGMLEELQTLDCSIDEQKAEQSFLRSGIAELEQTLTVMRDTLAEREEQLSALHREKAELETALQAEQDNIRRSETNMKEIRTNKEYQAVGREIAAARKQVADIEEQLLQLVTRADDLQQQINALQQEAAACEEATTDGAAEKQTIIDRLQQGIDGAVVQREALVKGLGNNLVRRYTQLREQRRGIALAEVRDGSCLGCNMQLPPQLFNSLFKGDEMYFCPHCQRILLLKQEQPSG